ncbi:C40 family peptidase [Gorillibacterium sp. sgz500922]|uniref:C40 family peptidase n=1 Tax=Gorillibacterium sp. sgz500922 TaxID=3446694 RepID=UPI003F66C7D1
MSGRFPQDRSAATADSARPASGRAASVASALSALPAAPAAQSEPTAAFRADPAGAGELRTVAVSVATLWTSPDSPRPLDAPVLGSPVDLPGWLASMDLAAKLDLYDANRVQTQALFGTAVIVLEERDDWVRVAVPDQPTRKDERGYPGWVPAVQLASAPGAAGSAESAGFQEDAAADAAWKAEGAEGTAVIAADRAGLYARPEGEPELGLSYLTELPYRSPEPGSPWLEVFTPRGRRYLRRQDALLRPRPVERNTSAAPQRSAGRAADAASSRPGARGRRIREQAVRFLGLPYLWGGMSSYGYDCSGFAYSMHRSQGILLPRDASDQARGGLAVEPGRELPGDLLFFAYEEGKGAVHHVGLYAGDGQMIHSPDSGSRIERVSLSGYKLIREHCASRRYW